MDQLLDRLQAALGDAFRVESELPAGGMSRIFLATEQSLNRHVVIKVLPPNMTSEVSSARFRQEMELLARLQHPHILPILSSGSRGELLYYVMPFVAGESLRHRLASEGRLPVADSIRILTEVADALGYAHAAGVLHRDIKPENILLEGRHAVLADFGVARALVDARTGGKLTATGVAVGTPGYMSPEQVSGDVIDARADLYALAVVGYEMMSGKPPFEGPTAVAILTAHLVTPPLPLTEVRPEVPPHVSNAIARALSKQPADRFLTGQEFADALGRDRQEAPAASAASVAKRSRRTALYVAAGAAILAAVAWTALRPRGASIPAPLLNDIRVAADSGRLDAVATLLDSAGAQISHRELRDIAARVAGSLRISSDLPGAEVAIARATPLPSFAARDFRVIGPGPTEALPLVAGEYSVRIARAGLAPRYVVSQVGLGTEQRVEVRMEPADSILGAMVRISAGRSPVDGSAVPEFLVSEFEVTNDQFQRFVSAGGYRDLSLWSPTMLIEDRPVPVADAIGRLVDRTGLAGPRNWEGGKYPAGHGDHPVTGVSWYEASAYASWAGGALPSGHQWWRAADGDSLTIYPWGSNAADAQYRGNLEGVETSAAGSYPLGVSRFGAMDMAGNVREWLADALPGGARYLAAGGSWQDPVYMADRAHMEGFPPSYASATIGFRVARPTTASGRNQ